MGWTPLIIASDNGHLQLCELLLDKGADIDHKSSVSITYCYHMICIMCIMIIIA